MMFDVIVGAILVFLFLMGILPIVAIILARKEKIVVFYDLSDAMLTAIINIIIVLISAIILGSYYTPWVDKGLPDSEIYQYFSTSQWGFLSILLASINIIMIAYSFYTVYLYNRHSLTPKRQIFIAFIGRYIISSSVNIVPIICYLLGLIAGFGYKHIIISILAIMIISLILYFISMKLLVYKSSFLSMENYINFKYMASLGEELAPVFRKKYKEKPCLLKEDRENSEK